MSDLASVLPALDEQVKLTWMKRDIAELTADAFHEDLMLLCSGTDEDFKKMLALYAGWAQYVTALNGQLEQMNCGQPFSVDSIYTHYPELHDNKELQARAEWQANSEGEAFVRQWDAVLLPSQGSWVQRVQPLARDQAEPETYQL